MFFCWTQLDGTRTTYCFVFLQNGALNGTPPLGLNPYNLMSLAGQTY